MAESRTDDRLPPLTERGKHPQGADLGGSSGSSPSRPGVEPREIDEPRDEGAVESLGRSIGEVVLGSDEEERKARERGR
jgi:hypothetical protein